MAGSQVRCDQYNGLNLTDKVYGKYLATLPCAAAAHLFPVKNEDDWYNTPVSCQCPSDLLYE